MAKIKNTFENLYLKNKYYKNFHHQNNNFEPGVVLFITQGSHQKHPGLMDRMKVVVSLYYIAKENHMRFTLVVDDIFPIEDFLCTSTYDCLDSSHLTFDRKKVEIFQLEECKEIPALDVSKQYHCYSYVGTNILKTTGFHNWKKEWGKLYRDLFEPTDYLERLIANNKPNTSYTSIHIRFVNALESFEKGYKSHLSEKEKIDLINRCIDCINTIKSHEQHEIMVFSDSKVFIKEVSKAGYKTLPEDDIGHVSYDINKHVWEKTFLDLYLMSRSSKIYSLQGQNLYSSVFSHYASMIGNVEYEVIRVD